MSFVPRRHSFFSRCSITRATLLVTETNPVPPKVQQTKAAKAAAAMAGGKTRKKKWSAQKMKDKAQHHVILDQPLYDRIFKEAATFKLVSVSVLVDRLKIGGSLARVALRDLEAKGIIKPVVKHSKQYTFTRTAAE